MTAQPTTSAILRGPFLAQHVRADGETILIVRPLRVVPIATGRAGHG